MVVKPERGWHGKNGTGGKKKKKRMELVESASMDSTKRTGCGAGGGGGFRHVQEGREDSWQQVCDTE